MRALWRATVLVGVLCLTLAGTAQARTDDRTKPVVFVHGFSHENSVNCRDSFRTMRQAFRSWGHTGAFATVAYYGGDRDCDHWTGHHGSHSTHYASGHEGKGHTRSSSIRHLGYHLAWYLWSHYSAHGQPVDVMAHSMGGLVIRYALAQTQRGHSRFPPYLLVEDVVTAGTPHGGARWFAGPCPYVQCDEMTMGSDFLNWLQDNGWNPQGRDGTDWSTFGSDDDNYVAADRAAGTADDGDPAHQYIGSCHKVWYTEPTDVEHEDFLTDTAKEKTAAVYRFSCLTGGWVADATSHWPGAQGGPRAPIRDALARRMTV